MATRELKLIIKKLKQVSNRSKDLDKEAEAALYGQRSSKEYAAKLTERGQLFIDLESSLAIPLSTLKGSEKKLATEIRSDIAELARSVKEAINNGSTLRLASFLTPHGSIQGDKDHLEELIELLESKK